MTYLTEDEFNKHLINAKQSPYLAVDTEGTLDHPFSTTWGASTSAKGVAEYFGFNHGMGSNLPQSWLPKLKETIENHPCLVFHHAKHDLRSLNSLGINYTGSFYDIMLMQHMIDENIFNKSLDSISRSLGGDPKKKPDEFKRIVDAFGWHAVPIQYMRPYGANDAYITEQAFHKLLQEFQAQGFDGELWETEQEFVRFLANMEDNGVLIDQSLSEQELERGLKIMREIENSLGFNPGSPIQLGKFLLEDLGLPIIKRNKPTKKNVLGNPSFDKEAMKVYDELLQRTNDKRASQVLIYRGWAKTTSSNYRAYLELLHKDGRLRPNFKMHGTRTGRLSCEHPNLQQIPRESSNDWNGHLKQAFITENGRTAWEVDFCVSPRTRILKTDLTWSTADKIKIGDELIGFDEDLHRSVCKMKPTKVTATKKLQKLGYRIYLDNGDILTCSDDHMWSAVDVKKYPKPLRHWKKTKDLQSGDKLLKYTESPWEIDESYNAGYLAGVYDGEGYVNGTTLGFGQNNGNVLHKVVDLLESYDFNFYEDKNSNSGVWRVLIPRTKQALRFLGMFRPVRLLQKARSIWENTSPYGKFNDTPSITKIENIGLIDVVAIETTEHTFIADGYMSHNCQLEFRLGAAYGKVKRLIEIFADPSRDVFTETSKDLRMTRQETKTLTYLLQFGGGVEKIMGVFGVSAQAARAVKNNYFKQYEGLARVANLAETRAKQNGYVKYWTGRRRHFPYSGDCRKAFNATVQGGAFEIVKRATLRLDKEGINNDECRIDLQVHDSLRFDIEDGKENIYLPEIVRVMEDVQPDFGVKFKVDVKRWGEK